LASSRAKVDIQVEPTDRRIKNRLFGRDARILKVEPAFDIVHTIVRRGVFSSACHPSSSLVLHCDEFLRSVATHLPPVRSPPRVEPRVGPRHACTDAPLTPRPRSLSQWDACSRRKRTSWLLARAG
jgi:hypothetical protein